MLPIIEPNHLKTPERNVLPRDFGQVPLLEPTDFSKQ
jgi:hypothetical protein